MPRARPPLVERAVRPRACVHRSRFRRFWALRSSGSRVTCYYVSGGPGEEGGRWHERKRRNISEMNRKREREGMSGAAPPRPQQQPPEPRLYRGPSCPAGTVPPVSLNKDYLNCLRTLGNDRGRCPPSPAASRRDRKDNYDEVSEVMTMEYRSLSRKNRCENRRCNIYFYKKRK